MLFKSFIPAAVTLAGLASACPGIDHAHGLAPRQVNYSTTPSGGESLLRHLVWGDLVVLATTDIHGWYQGHQKASYPEPNYSGDWGDFASFVSHMRKLAKDKGVDLLLVDSGDLHDGAGLSDGYPAGQVDGQTSNQFHAKVDYDLLTVGNHELYKYDVAWNTLQEFVPEAKGRYLGSNVNISHAGSDGGANVTYTYGDRFVKFQTDGGRNVTSLGVLFNFTGADSGITVQDPAKMVNETWFNDAIQEQPDVFLIAGHMPVRNDQFPVVVNAIRKVHPTTPIMILGGHTHIRDCTQYDRYSMGLEAGRYLETIGWMAMNFTDNGPTFNRSYIDANRRNYAFHAGLSSPSDNFDTALGLNITQQMNGVADAWNLSHVYGVAPQDYYLQRVPINDTSSLINFMTNQVLPTVISTSNPDRKDVPNLVIANSGSQRFDLYAGNFTKNDQYIVSPFTDAFQYIQDVPYKYASQIINKLNRVKSSSARRAIAAVDEEEREKYAKGHVSHIYNAWMKEQHFFATSQSEAVRDLARLDARAAAEAANRTLGYVTKDSCPGAGDDTVHTAIPYASVPDYVQSPVTGSNVTANTTVDVIFLDFIAKNVVSILNGLQKDRNYTLNDVASYNQYTIQDIYPLYAEQVWANNGTNSTSS
ncbi:Phosphoesterase domain protein [Kalmanozyma brasiliensis GHG001]|uniref:Calcineurin-like phosphoesterase domain-containing protein n=1 Tax=Kalmanozyma brasiliensis (strain GHG001) TaxID=1365824 RepID=V5GH63_KALBG|nr:Phosphoesterase domain protein [Kalmanozyma brasiliensis GHG001]EST05352.1 Phosphoesterase domain protein [Kalmanozyma brasiliensis GHG001]